VRVEFVELSPLGNRDREGEAMFGNRKRRGYLRWCGGRSAPIGIVRRQRETSLRNDIMRSAATRFSYVPVVAERFRALRLQ